MTGKDQLTLYEGVYLISSTLSEEARKKAMGRIESGITDHGGEVLNVINWGRRKLAYDIAGHREGWYFVLYFKAKPSAIDELWQEYHLNEDLIRFFTLKTDEVKETIEFPQLVETE